MKELLGFIIDKALVLIPVLSIIGAILKGTPKIPNWVIPYVLGVCGVAGAIGIMGVTVEAVFQGVLVAGASVFGYEAFKALREGTENKDV